MPLRCDAFKKKTDAAARMAFACLPAVLTVYVEDPF